MFEMKVVEKLKTHFMFDSLPPPPCECRNMWWNQRCRKQHGVCAHTHTHTQKYVILVLRGNSGYVNAHKCHVIRTLPVLFSLCTRCSENRDSLVVWAFSDTKPLRSMEQKLSQYFGGGGGAVMRHDRMD